MSITIISLYLQKSNGLQYIQNQTILFSSVSVYQFAALYIFFKKLFIYLWLCWAFVSVRGLSLAVASGGHSSSRCAGPSLLRPLLLRSTGSRRAGSVIVAHGPSCSAACGIFPDQGSNPCPLHQQADSQPLRHQGSPHYTYFKTFTSIVSEVNSSSHNISFKENLCINYTASILLQLAFLIGPK